MKMNIKFLLSTAFFAVVLMTVNAQERRILNLEECKERALKNNAGIQTGKIDVEVAKQTKKEAFTKYFPQISAGAVTYKADDNLIKATVPPIPPLGLDETRDQVELETENYFWKIVSLKEAEKTLDILDSLLQNLHKDVSLAVKAGITTQNDLLTVQLKQNELSSTRLQVENGIKLSCMALCQYIGIPLDSASCIDVPEFNSDIKGPEEYLVDHQAVLPSLNTYKLLDKNVEVHELKRKINFGQQLPTLGIGASYAYEDLMFDKKRNHLMMMATVSIPISDWWGGSHKTKRSRLEEEKAICQQQDGCEKLLLKMQQSWNLLTESYKQIILAESAVKESEENLRMQTNNYRCGVSSLSELLDAQGLYQTSRGRYTDACINYKIKLTQYMQDTGR